MYKTVTSEFLPIAWHRCDVCGHEACVVYVLQLDKWYCVDCVKIACRLLRQI